MAEGGGRRGASCSVATKRDRGESIGACEEQGGR